MTRLISHVAVIIALGATGCDRSRSTADADRQRKKLVSAYVDRIERSIQSLPCIGAIGHWERLYGLSRRDDNDLKFFYREAGKFGFISGRTIRDSDDWYEIDDRSYRAVYGSFDISRSKLNVEYCGLNAPVPDEDPRQPQVRPLHREHGATPAAQETPPRRVSPF